MERSMKLGYFIAGLACLLPLALAEEHDGRISCRATPALKADGEDPVAKARGDVIVLALLTSSCSYCQLQARLLMKMKAKLQAMNITGVSFIIVNSKEADMSKHIIDKLVDFKVYQDKTGNISKVLNGSRDDFYIFNRCGILSDYVPGSKSYLRKNNVQQALLKALIGSHGCATCKADAQYQTKYEKLTKAACWNTAEYDQYCGEWAGRDLCKKGNKFYGFMTDHCRKTCKFCTVAESKWMQMS